MNLLFKKIMSSTDWWYRCFNKISINIYTYEKDTVRILPVRISESEHSEEVYILLLQEGERQHYMCSLLTDLGSSGRTDRFLQRTCRMFCPRCIQGFRVKSSFKNHIEICKYFKSYSQMIKLQRTKMPQKGKVMK